MKRRKEKQSSKIDNLVNNNPEYDRITRDPEEVAADKEASKNTLYDSSYYKTYAGHWKRRASAGLVGSRREQGLTQVVLRLSQSRIWRKSCK